jgi:hypothetical protein
MDETTSQMDTTHDEDAEAVVSSSKKKKEAALGRSHSAKLSDAGDSYKRRVRRSASERRVGDDDQDELTVEEDGTLTRRTKKGDIYTKVAMPRSKSFMNVAGPYNLQELFKELKDKEGIESVDDILRHIITRDGMSFARTEPMYRELLMKLAMSVSADEMFIRSKNIMMQDRINRGGAASREESSKPFSRVFGLFGMNRNKQKLAAAQVSRVSKADIGGPLPVSEEAKRELSKQWMKVTPQLAAAATMQQQQRQQQRQQQQQQQQQELEQEHAASTLSTVKSPQVGTKSTGLSTSATSGSSGGGNANRSNTKSSRKKSNSPSCSECGGYQSTSAFSYSQERNSPIVA